MELPYDEGTQKAFLYDDEHSGFADEEEYLLAGIGWRVKSVEETDDLEHDAIPFDVTVIRLATD